VQAAHHPWLMGLEHIATAVGQVEEHAAADRARDTNIAELEASRADLEKVAAERDLLRARSQVNCARGRGHKPL
jgi:hypothetical protein